MLVAIVRPRWLLTENAPAARSQAWADARAMLDMGRRNRNSMPRCTAFRSGDDAWRSR
jgi:hypothetical protein